MYCFSASQFILQTFLTLYKAFKVKKSEGYLDTAKLHNFYNLMFDKSQCFSLRLLNFALIFFLFFSFPWDQSTFPGYCAVIIISIVFVASFIYTNSLFKVFFMAVCLHLEALYNHFVDSIGRLNRIWEPNSGLDNHERDFETKKRLVDGVHFHIKCKE